MNRAWIELSKEALQHNIEAYQSILGDKTKIMAVVKANAYGHGAVLISHCLRGLGIDFFAVASVDEAIELRKSGLLDCNILILGYTNPDYFFRLHEYDLIQTVTGKEHFDMLREYANKSQNKLKVHVAIDTGMHRIGYDSFDYAGIKEVFSCEHLDVCGIYSHMCVASEGGEENEEYSKLQIRRFKAIIERLNEDGFDGYCKHLLGSHAGINYKDDDFDYARLGVLMYGVKILPDDYIKTDIKLRPVMTIKTAVASIREINPDETVSYGRTFKADKKTKVAVLAIGYADGIPRSLSNGKLRVMIKGQYAYGIGRICMDMLMVDVTDIDDVKVGDEAVIIGKSQDNVIYGEELAVNSDSITHELYSRISSRLELAGFVS